MNTYIFGAKATAAGLYKALTVLQPEKNILGFLVSSMEGNASEIWGVPVMTVKDICDKVSDTEKENIEIYVAVPKTLHDEIGHYLNDNAFYNVIFIDSQKEASIMERYFVAEGKYKSVHSLPSHATSQNEFPKLTVYAASFYKDKPLKNPPDNPSYVKKIFLGCDGAIKAGVDIAGKADFYDNIGDNISDKNPNRCEMTAHYWVWKNRLETDDEYVGICHYRRTLDLSEDDLFRIKENDVDVVLPFPMLHYPSAEVQHTWYVPEKDWLVLKKVVKELYPDYGARFDEIFSVPEFYNYNMMIAKKQVFADYCSWLYPILDRIEECSEPKGSYRHDRYTAFMSESLTNLYFMANLNNLKIFHTGRLLYV